MVTVDVSQPVTPDSTVKKGEATTTTKKECAVTNARMTMWKCEYVYRKKKVSFSPLQLELWKL